MVNDPDHEKSQRVFSAMHQMKMIDIGELKRRMMGRIWKYQSKIAQISNYQGNLT